MSIAVLCWVRSGTHEQCPPFHDAASAAPLHLIVAAQVASYMRAVLRTLAQCHHHRILHRDIKVSPAHLTRLPPPSTWQAWRRSRRPGSTTLHPAHTSSQPGNFMLLTDLETSPVKAIDFGLAVFFDPKVRAAPPRATWAPVFCVITHACCRPATTTRL